MMLMKKMLENSIDDDADEAERIAFLYMNSSKFFIKLYLFLFKAVF